MTNLRPQIGNVLVFHKPRYFATNIILHRHGFRKIAYQKLQVAKVQLAAEPGNVKWQRIVADLEEWRERLA